MNIKAITKDHFGLSALSLTGILCICLVGCTASLQGTISAIAYSDLRNQPYSMYPQTRQA